MEVTNGQEPYIITWDLPQLLEYYRCLQGSDGILIAGEKLETVKNKLVNGIENILPNVPIWLIESDALQKRCDELRILAELAYPNSTFLTIDSLYFPNNKIKLQVTRILDWESRNSPSPVRSPGARPGFLPPEEQAKILASKEIKNVIIGDAGIFDGGTLKFIKSVLGKQNIQIDAFVGAICGKNAPNITNDLNIDLYPAVQLRTELYEWIEARDFFDGIVPGGGIVVGKRSKVEPNMLKPLLWGGYPLCIPYNRGFPDWSSIPSEKFGEFQELCSGLRMEIRKELEQSLDMQIKPSDLVRISQAYLGQVRGEIPVNLNGSVFPTPISWDK